MFYGIFMFYGFCMFCGISLICGIFYIMWYCLCSVVLLYCCVFMFYGILRFWSIVVFRGTVMLCGILIDLLGSFWIIIFRGVVDGGGSGGGGRGRGGILCMVCVWGVRHRCYLPCSVLMGGPVQREVELVGLSLTLVLLWSRCLLIYIFLLFIPRTIAQLSLEFHFKRF